MWYLEKAKWWLPGTEGRGYRELLFNRCRVLVLQDEKVLEITQKSEYT